MALPDLRHFTRLAASSSDPVEALVGEAWVPAIYTDKGWTTADGGKLSADIIEWRTPCLNTPGQTPEASTQKERWQKVKAKKPPGLYANIAAKRKRIEAGSDERMARKGEAGRPTAAAFKAAAKTAKKPKKKK
jgi:hypothetical protein